MASGQRFVGGIDRLRGLARDAAQQMGLPLEQGVYVGVHGPSYETPAEIRAFRTIAAHQRGEVTAEVTSAHALTDAQIDQLKTRLTAREGRTVKLSTKVDPDLLGGLVVTIGSKRIDGSIRTRLNSLAQAMKA